MTAPFSFEALTNDPQIICYGPSLSINLATLANSQHQNFLDIVLDVADDAAVTNPIAP